MPHDPPPPKASQERDWPTWRLRLIAAGFLGAWLAMLWFMFGDVL